MFGYDAFYRLIAVVEAIVRSVGKVGVVLIVIDVGSNDVTVFIHPIGVSCLLHHIPIVVGNQLAAALVHYKESEVVTRSKRSDDTVVDRCPG